jgi:alpha-amylase
MGLSVASGDLQTAPDAASKQDGDGAVGAAGDGAVGPAAAASTGHASAPFDSGSDQAADEPASPVLHDSSSGPDGGGSDAASNPLDGGPADATLSDGSLTVPASCSVSFTVADAFVDGVIDTGVAIGGDTSALGAWDPDAAVPMTSLGAGAWTASLVMNDGQAVQFLFVKRGPGSYMWENWGVNSNRSLVVSCSPDADDASDSGATDGGPVVGTAYAGQFGVKPPDAT